MTLDDIELGRCTVHCCAPGLLGGRWKTRKYFKIEFYPVFIVRDFIWEKCIIY